MKSITTILLLLIFINTFGQPSTQIQRWKNEILNNTALYKKEYKDELLKYDFGSLWTLTNNASVYGYIGEHFQRIRVKIITVTKDTSHENSYHIYGKSMVKNNVCSFNGTIKISAVRIFRKMHWGVDEEYKKKGIKKQGVSVAEYHFEEDSTLVHAGVFEGTLITWWYIDSKGRIRYDDIRHYSDNYCNNQFAGTWSDYKTNRKKVCNWGDHRIPFSRSLDIGAGDFSPDQQYVKYGWQSYSPQEEEKKWWK